MKRLLPVRPVFFASIAILFVRGLIILKHQPGRDFINALMLASFGLLFILAVAEMYLSKKASAVTKTVWIPIYTILPVAAYFFLEELFVPAIIALGVMYMNLTRPYFLFSRQDIDSQQKS